MHRNYLLLVLCLSAPLKAQDICSYQTWAWDTHSRKAVNHEVVHKPYSDISADEVDAYTGCSVCEQDQQEISVAPLKPFKMCWVLASQVEEALRHLLVTGEPITEVVGYRVGLTRGPVDAAGLRTRFSNHAFGIALDINPQANGLYENCVEFGESCRLIRGGEWFPGQPGSISADGAIVAGFDRIGLRWGGEISGRQKDFMHFSPDGY